MPEAATEAILSRGEKLFNVAAALSIYCWAGMGLRDAWQSSGTPTVRLSIATLNICVGTLFLIRAPLRAIASPAQVLLAIVSFLGGAIPLTLAPRPHTWPALAQIAFCMGIFMAAISLVCLGRSFAILPGVRGIVVSGPYRIVRHPAYAGELVAVAGCFLAQIHWASAMALAASAAALVVRIRIEESLLSQTPEYREYSNRVRSRLIPGLW